MSIRVEAQTMDDYCKRKNIYPDLIKIDVEGHEWQVLWGARQTISLVKPTMIVEVWHDSPRKKDIYEYLTTESYRIFALGRKPIQLTTGDEFVNCRQANFVFCADPAILRHL